MHGDTYAHHSRYTQAPRLFTSITSIRADDEAFVGRLRRFRRLPPSFSFLSLSLSFISLLSRPRCTRWICPTHRTLTTLPWDSIGLDRARSRTLSRRVRRKQYDILFSRERRLENDSSNERKQNVSSPPVIRSKLSGCEAHRSDRANNSFFFPQIPPSSPCILLDHRFLTYDPKYSVLVRYAKIIGIDVSSPSYREFGSLETSKASCCRFFFYSQANG